MLSPHRSLLQRPERRSKGSCVHLYQVMAHASRAWGMGQCYTIWWCNMEGRQARTEAGYDA